MNAILEAVLNSLWQAAGVALAAWLVLRLMPRINAATRYAVWWAVLALVVVLPVVKRDADHRPAAAFRSEVAPGKAARSAGRPAPVDAVCVSCGLPAGNLPHAPVELDAGRWPVAVWALWTLAGCLLLARVVWSYGYLRSVKRRARPADGELRMTFDAWLLSCRIRRPVRLLVSSQVGSPMAVGFLHPAVILPEPILDDFTQADLDHVLLHELAHVARRDDWTNLAARLASAALALHPVAAWVLHWMDREREIACDDWVVANTGAARSYAASLTRLFELCQTRRTLLASGMAGDASQLGNRVEMLLHRGREFTPRTSAVRFAVSAVLLLLLVAAGASTPRWIAFAQAARNEPRPAITGGPHGSFLAALVAAGYGDLPVDEIVELKVQGVTADFLMGMSQSGWGRLTTRQLIDWKVQGVTPDYARKMRNAGLRSLTVDDLVQLKVQGVPPEYIREVHASGFGPYSAAEAIELKIQGVPPELFRALKEAGLARAERREIIDAKIQGLRSADLREAKKYGSNLTLKQIVRLKQAGVI